MFFNWRGNVGNNDENAKTVVVTEHEVEKGRQKWPILQIYKHTNSYIGHHNKHMTTPYTSQI